MSPKNFIKITILPTFLVALALPLFCFGCKDNPYADYLELFTELRYLPTLARDTAFDFSFRLKKVDRRTLYFLVKNKTNKFKLRTLIMYPLGTLSGADLYISSIWLEHNSSILEDEARYVFLGAEEIMMRVELGDDLPKEAGTFNLTLRGAVGVPRGAHDSFGLHFENIPLPPRPVPKETTKPLFSEHQLIAIAIIVAVSLVFLGWVLMSRGGTGKHSYARHEDSELKQGGQLHMWFQRRRQQHTQQREHTDEGEDPLSEDTAPNTAVIVIGDHITSHRQQLPEAGEERKNGDLLEARAAARSWLESFRYRRGWYRTYKNLTATTLRDKALIETLKTKKELYKESGMVEMVNQLPKKERMEVELAELKVQTEIMQQRKQQAELQAQIRELEKPKPEPTPKPKSPTTEERIIQSAMDKIKTLKAKGTVQVEAQQAKEESLAAIDRNKNPELHKRLENMWNDFIAQQMEE